MLIVFSMFIALFLLNNNFILVVLPQTFALHRLMVLSHTTVHEWCNLFIPLFVVACYYSIIIASQKNMFDKVVPLDFQNQIFQWKDEKEIIVRYKNNRQ